MIILSIGAVVVVGLVLSRVARASRGTKQQAPAQPPAPQAAPPRAEPAAKAEPEQAETAQDRAAPSAAVVPAPAPDTGASLDPADPAWSEARRLRRALLARQVPETIGLWEVVPEEGEVFFYDVPAVYDRYYGQDATYQRAGGLLLGSPAFLLAGLAVTGLANAQRRRAAEQQAATQWRDRQPTRVVVTNHRLVCLLGGQWLSYHYSAMNAVYPEVAARTLVCGFASIPPLRLSGADAPILAVMTIFATHGLQGLADHPSLRALD